MRKSHRATDRVNRLSFGRAAQSVSRASCIALVSLVGIATAHGQMHSDANVPFANSMFRIPDAPPPRVASYDEATGACAGDRCYGQSAMGWSQNIVACARGVRIGVISSGIDARHPAFAGTALAHNNLTP